MDELQNLIRSFRACIMQEITAQQTNASTTSKDQVAETRRLLKEMNDRADRAIDEQVAASTTMTPRK
jgi:hypothetical protein